MIRTNTCLSRRTVLRGLGTTVALPLLDSMIPASAAAAGPTPTKRFAAVYVPMGMHMAQWTPRAEGALELMPIQSTWAPFRRQLTIVGGLDSQMAADTADEPAGPHSRVQTTWLTGCRAKRTEGADFRAGTSIDQLAAREIGEHTQLPSLELALETVEAVGACDWGYTCAYTSTLAWRTPTTPLPMEVNPRNVFERLFGDNTSTEASVRLARARTDASILDSVVGEITELERRLGAQDRIKVTEYLDAVRDIERRIQKAERQQIDLPVVQQPTGVPESYAEHAALMFDLLALAFQSDVTRISTFMMSRELSSRSYPEIGVPDSHHPLSHHGNDPEKLARLGKLNAFHAGLLARFLQKLQDTRDGDGTLLDHTLLLYGSGFSNPNSHVPFDLPTAVFAGSAFGIPGDRFVRAANGTPLANLQLTLLGSMGVRIERFGDSTGALQSLSL